MIFDHDRGKTHSSGKLLYSSRVIPYRGSWLDFEFDHKDLVYIRIDRRRKLYATILLRAIGFTSQEILEKFYEKETYLIGSNGYSLKVVPRRMVGKIAPSDIKGTQGVIIEAGKRITARHIRLIESSKIKTLEVPKESLFNQTIAEDIIDPSTGEIEIACNTLIDEEVLLKLSELKLEEINVLYIQ